MVIPYVVEMSKNNRYVCRKYGIKVVFRSGQTLHSTSSRVQDMSPLGKQSNVVYYSFISCGQACNGETKQKQKTKAKEHQNASERGITETSAIEEQAWGDHHSINWEEILLVDHAIGYSGSMH